MQKEYEVRIESAGKYIVDFHCRISESGVLMAVALCDDEMGYFISMGGDYLYVESEPLNLDSGGYTLSVYCITDEEEWEAFRELLSGVKMDVKDASEMDFPYQETDQATLTGSYWIRRVSAEERSQSRWKPPWKPEKHCY